MQTKVKRWGNSLALRIPKALADQVSISAESRVEISIVGKQIVIAPFPEPELTLDELLDSITEDNLHEEIDTGPILGNESW
jgi:antitoxin MazE